MGEIIGGAIGGLVQAGVNAYNAHADRKATKEAQEKGTEAIGDIRTDTGNTYAALMADNDAYWQRRGSMGTAEDAAAAAEAIRNYDPNANVYNFDKYSYNKTMNDFVNPYYDQIIQATTDQLQHTAAGAGLGRGTGAALGIAKGVAEQNAELYRDAFNMYNTERNADYQQYVDYIKNMQAKNDTINANQQYQIDAMGKLGGDYFAAMDAAQETKNNITQDKMGSDVAYATAIGSLYT